MKLTDAKYNRYALVREMLETADIVRTLDVERILAHKPAHDKIFLSGEGSSRIFPAKRLLTDALRYAYRQTFQSEAGEQARDYRLDSWAVFAASNSGHTAEVVRLIQHLHTAGHHAITAVTAHTPTPVSEAADATYRLSCGTERAVAATKSVVEQALFYDLLFRSLNGAPPARSAAPGRCAHRRIANPRPRRAAAAAG